MNLQRHCVAHVPYLQQSTMAVWHSGLGAHAKRATHALSLRTHIQCKEILSLPKNTKHHRCRNAMVTGMANSNLLLLLQFILAYPIRILIVVFVVFILLFVVLHRLLLLT